MKKCHTFVLELKYVIATYVIATQFFLNVSNSFKIIYILYIYIYQLKIIHKVLI